MIAGAVLVVLGLSVLHSAQRHKPLGGTSGLQGPRRRVRSWAGAALASKANDPAAAGDLLAEAIKLNEQFVVHELGLAKPASDQLPKELHAQNTISADRRNRLSQLLTVKKPERRPELAVTLIPADVERFSAAVEYIAIGNAQEALVILRSLEKKYPEQQHLRSALAAAELVYGNAAEARASFYLW